MHITHVKGGKHLHMRTCRCAPFLYLRNGWTDCAEIWCVVVRDTLARRLTKVKSVVLLHGRTCKRADEPLFRTSEMAGRISLKFGVLLENQAPYKSLGWGTAAHSYSCTTSSYLVSGWTDCAKIWHAVRDLLDKRFTESPIG